MESLRNARSRTPPRPIHSSSAKRRYRRRLREIGGEILALVKKQGTDMLDNLHSDQPLTTYSRSLLLSQRCVWELASLPLTNSVSAACTAPLSLCSPELASDMDSHDPSSLAWPMSIAPVKFGSELPLQLNPEAPIFTFGLAAGGQCEPPAEVTRLQFAGDSNWDSFLQRYDAGVVSAAAIRNHGCQKCFSPRSENEQSIEQSFAFGSVQVPARKRIREPNLLVEFLPDLTQSGGIGISGKHESVKPAFCPVNTCEMDNSVSDAEMSDDYPDGNLDPGIWEDSDSDEGFRQELPTRSAKLYIHLVPDRFMWDPGAGLGETEWRELVQMLAVRSRKKLDTFESQIFPLAAARRLLAIMAVQCLKSAWTEYEFGKIFAQRFEHRELVMRAIDVFVDTLCDDFKVKRSQFIDKGLVRELLV